jgi:acetolactate synthase-1/2/3 large subunit
MTAARTGSHVLIESLLAQGCDTVFGIPGVATLPIYDAFLDHQDIRPIGVRHEQAAVFMADGHARSTGRIAVALTSAGPGALNSVTAMATAYNDSVPLLHIVNENPAHVRNAERGYFHDISDQFGIFRDVTGFGIQVRLAAEIPAAIDQALDALRNRRARPAMVEIGAEALTDTSDIDVIGPAIRRIHAADPESITAAAELIGDAERPVIWAGGGVVASGGSDELLRLAELTGAPVLTSQAGKGSIVTDHPLHVGNWANEQPVRDLLDRSDLLIAIGTRFSYFPTGGWSLRPPARMVQIDLDPASIGRNYPASVGVVGDAATATQQLLDRLAETGYQGLEPRSDEVAAALAAIAAAVGTPVELDVLHQVRDALPPDAHVFNDPTTLAFWARSAWMADVPRTWFVPSGFGTLGYALPAAIGSSVGDPDSVSVAIIGDGGVMFTIQDLMTAVQEEIPVVALVFNDEGYGVERRHQTHLYGRHSGVDVQPPDFVALARSFGAEGMLVDDLSQVGDAIAEAAAMRRPVLVEIPNRFSHPGYGSWGSY